VVALAPALYRGSVDTGTDEHRVGDELGIAFAPSFRPRARPNREQACCSHSRKARALVLPHPYWVADLRVLEVHFWMRPVGARVPLVPKIIWGKED